MGGEKRHETQEAPGKFVNEPRQDSGAALQQPLCLMKRKSSARGAEVDPRSQHFNGRCLHLIRPPTGRTPLLPL